MLPVEQIFQNTKDVEMALHVVFAIRHQIKCLISPYVIAILLSREQKETLLSHEREIPVLIILF